MFKISDEIIYGVVGICAIVDISEKDFTGENHKYYVLRPYDSTKSLIYVPVDNEKLIRRMKNVPSKKGLDIIIRKSNESIEWIENHLERAQKYKDLMADGDILNCLKLYRTFKKRKEELSAHNKYLPKTDDYLYKDCSKFLRGVISKVMAVDQDEALELYFNE